MIPAIQAFFEIVNYWANLLSQVWSFVHDAFVFISASLHSIYNFVTMLPPWLSFFALMAIAYQVVVFVIHPE